MRSTVEGAGLTAHRVGHALHPLLVVPFPVPGRIA